MKQRASDPPHRTQPLEAQLFRLGLLLPFVVIPCYLFYQKVLLPFVPFEGCIWDLVFGIYCPGCGGTRAIEALISGHISESLRYHPFVGYSVFLYLTFMLTQLVQRLTKGRIRGMRFRNGYLYGAVLLILANCLIRNLLRFRFGVSI